MTGPITDEALLHQLQNLRTLFREAAPTDAKTINDYAWLMVKLLNAQVEELGSAYCRQLLADYLALPTQRPSQLHSAILGAAVKVTQTYPDFRFPAFLRMWDLRHLRPEDRERQHAADRKTFPSLVERTTKALGNSLLLHPDQAFDAFLLSQGYSIRPMLVTRIKDALGKDGRKYVFVTLTSAEGIEVETIAHNLRPSPLHPLPEGKRHFVNIGQLYDCLLREKSQTTGTANVDETNASDVTIVSAYLSTHFSTDVFPTAIGYVEAVDEGHGHIHIYDSLSRHFVAHIQRFSKEKAGDFVRFIPIVPQTSMFKSAILLSIVPPSSPEVQNILREVRITAINKEKGYAVWELTDPEHPITEQLSPLQLAQGETSPSFTSGYLHLTEELSSSLALSSYKALIYLKRGKDRQKRPHLASLFPL